ncbi:translation machinery-associated 16 protein [Rutstroemia sp. NJR-2017a WRK4]|nr:translation machinery-associated 16 protein [Rutstroemia sp. NJR-2017a WRK4]
MPTTLQKVRKQIAKKKGGQLGAMHDGSRNMRRLRAAGGRDDKLSKLAASKKRQNQPLLERAHYFQEAVRNNGVQPLEIDAIHSLIKTFVHQHDEELSELKKERRSGRPASTKEDLLKIKIAADEKEYEKGFYLPDLTDIDTVMALDRWEDSAWAYLSTLKWVRLSSSGLIQQTKFPPTGDS